MMKSAVPRRAGFSYGMLVAKLTPPAGAFSRPRDQREVATMYIGPDSMMPIVSAMATIAAGVVAFWHRIKVFVMTRFGRRRKHGPEGA
jgi:ABC-type transport system involved in cytochrome c biogenesis permease subunit